MWTCRIKCYWWKSVKLKNIKILITLILTIFLHLYYIMNLHTLMLKFLHYIGNSSKLLQHAHTVKQKMEHVQCMHCVYKIQFKNFICTSVLHYWKKWFLKTTPFFFLTLVILPSFAYDGGTLGRRWLLWLFWYSS